MQKIRKTKKRSLNHTLLAVLLVVLIAAVGIELIQLGNKLSQAKAQEAQLTAQVQQQQQENDSLQADLDRANDPEFIKELARDQLGLAEDGERIFYDVSK
jgi:cell division protein FtsL